MRREYLASLRGHSRRAICAGVFGNAVESAKSEEALWREGEHHRQFKECKSCMPFVAWTGREEARRRTALLKSEVVVADLSSECFSSVVLNGYIFPAAAAQVGADGLCSLSPLAVGIEGAGLHFRHCDNNCV